jgi:phage-related protein (TIGR01555 family)
MPSPASSRRARTPRRAFAWLTDTVMQRSRARRRAAFEPFSLAQNFPPNARPRDADMAQDEGLSSAAAWANGAIGSAFAEGMAFLGYAELSVLAQRAEYRVISETIAYEMTREWIKLKSAASKDKTEKIDRIEKRVKALRVREACRKAIEGDGFFGRGHIFVDIGEDTTDDRDELKTSIGNGRNAASRNKVSRERPVVALRPVEAVWAYPTQYNSNDPLKSNWYRPETWYVMGKEVHATRLLTLIGREVPDLLKPAYAFGGLSMTQMVKPYVDNWLRTRQSVADLIHSFSVSGLMADLGATTQADGDRLFERAEFFTNMRDNRGLMLLNKDTEEFFNVSTPLGTLDALQAQTQEHMAAVARIPIVKLLGIQPAGLNASSEGEIRAFYDWIKAFQEHLLRRLLETILDLVQLSEFGEVDPDITFDFVDLWQLDEAGTAAVQQTKATTHEIYTTMGAVDVAEVRRALAADPDTPYAGLDIERDEAGVEPEAASGGAPRASVAERMTNRLEGQAASYGGAETGGFKAAA